MTNGVSGQGSTTGVRGESFSGTGAYGTSNSGVGTIRISNQAAGVYGISTNGPGVYAASGAGPSVFAESSRTAVWGRSVAGAGVFGQATDNGIGVYGAAGAGGWAGYFEGNVYVSGRMTQAGAAASMATAADGSTRTLYSLDTAEPLVEDVGAGALADGRADVALDPSFAAVVAGDAYTVFLAEEGDHRALFVEKKSPIGFTVRAKGSPTAGGTFGYRVLARRTGSTGRRLERVTPPKKFDAKDLEPPKLPELPRSEPPRPERPSPR